MDKFCLGIIGRCLSFQPWINISDLYHRRLREMLEKQDAGWFISNYIMEFLFYVAIPALSYAYFYIILPFEGARTGVIIALVALVFGALPTITGIIVRIKFSMPYIVFLLFSFLIKISGSLIIIGYLYSL